jgi:ribulose-5-phosphate 4-epimerase/fuculose-1-phosphate aldolase
VVVARTLDDLPPRTALTEIAHDFHARGWMLGTAGNLSAPDVLCEIILKSGFPLAAKIAMDKIADLDIYRR